MQAANVKANRIYASVETAVHNVKCFNSILYNYCTIENKKRFTVK